MQTVDPQTLRPSVRTVVYRGFLPRRMLDDNAAHRDEESCCLMFITDDRASKCRHLASAPSSRSAPPPVEVCWWLDEAGVQFRLSGHAVLATAQSEDPALRGVVEEMWERLGPSTRRTFSWPTPGAPRGVDDGKTEEEEEASPRDDESSPPLSEAHFALVIVVPDFVDELHLGGNQRRIVYRREGEAEMDGDAAVRSRAGALAGIATASWSEEAVNP